MKIINRDLCTFSEKLPLNKPIILSSTLGTSRKKAFRTAVIAHKINGCSALISLLASDFRYFNNGTLWTDLEYCKSVETIDSRKKLKSLLKWNVVSEGCKYILGIRKTYPKPNTRK